VFRLPQPVVLAIIASALAANGCDGRCVDACGIRNACAVDPEPLDCVGLCSFEHEQADVTGCAESYDGWLDCRTGLDDLCAATGEECLGSQGEFDACVLAFCAENAAHEACVAD